MLCESAHIFIFSSIMSSFSSSPYFPLKNTMFQKETQTQIKVITMATANHSHTRRKPMSKVLALKKESQPPSPSSITLTTQTMMKQLAQHGEKILSSLIALSQIPQTISYFLTTLNNTIINPPLLPSVDPRIVLSGNYVPVDETPPTECLEVEGELPRSLRGTYIRNGPNPQHGPHGPYHLFDGDGMLHSIRLSDGNAIFCSRYVNTHKFRSEHDAGVPVMPNFFAGFYGLAHLGSVMRMLGRAMIGQVSMFRGFGLANTSVALLGDDLYAMHEMDLPYALKLTEEGDIKTVGRWDFARKAPASMTAHPKVDNETGEVFAFRWSILSPYINFFCLDSNGSKKQDVPIYSMDHYVHDFAITKHFAVFPETQFEVTMFKMMMCKGMPVRYKHHRVPRIGVIPRYPESGEEMRWFPVTGFNAMHIVNAWEDDGDGLVIIAPNSGSSNFTTTSEIFCCSLEKLRIDLRTDKVTRTVLSGRNLELGSINPRYAGKKNKYVYISIMEKGPKMSGVVKIDLELGCEVACRIYGAGCFGGEALFVPNDESTGEEDDGFVVSYVHDEVTQLSTFMVLDAKSPTLEVLATVKLPRRVPYGLHGLFVGENM